MTSYIRRSKSLTSIRKQNDKKTRSYSVIRQKFFIGSSRSLKHVPIVKMNNPCQQLKEAFIDAVVDKMFKEPGMNKEDLSKDTTTNYHLGARLNEVEADLLKVGPIKLGNAKIKGDVGASIDSTVTRNENYKPKKKWTN